MSLDARKIGEIIANAVKVLISTYENLSKFFEELDRIACQEGFESISPRFLRYKSDNDPAGWLIKGFIKLYQYAEDPLLGDGSGLKDGPIYGVRITLGMNEEVPQINICKYEYADLTHWGKLPAVSEYWGFSQPLYRKDQMVYSTKGDYTHCHPKDDQTAERYWSLKELTYKTIELIPIHSEDKIRTSIIGEFKKLRV